MKIDINENDFFYSLTIKPETIAEATLLFRLAAQTKKEPVSFFADFSFKEMDVELIINRKKKNRLEFITNETKEK